jgi:hypothetical protein
LSESPLTPPVEVSGCPFRVKILRAGSGLRFKEPSLTGESITAKETMVILRYKESAYKGVDV